MVNLYKNSGILKILVALLLSFMFAATLPLEVEDIQNYLNRVGLIDSGDYNLGFFFIWDKFFLVVYNLIGEKYLIFSIRFILYLLLIFACLNELKRKIWILLILFSPFVIEHFYGALRQGLAFVFFIIAYYSPYRLLRIMLFSATIFIHPLSFWWLATYVSSLLAFKFNTKFILIVFSFFSFFLLKVIFQIPLVGAILMYGERYEFADSDRSFFGLFFWVIILCITLLIKERKLDTYVVIFSLLQLILLYNNFESIYRYFQSLLPIFIIYNLNNHNNRYSKVIILLYIIFVFIHFVSYYSKLFP